MSETDPGDVVVRPARPDDAAAVSLVHRSDVIAWKRWDAHDQPLWAEYERLTAFERWLNGGPWMDEELCRRHLAHMQGTGRVALVAEVQGAVCAEAEAYFGEEPAPFGSHLNLTVLYTRRGHSGHGLGSALLRSLTEKARASGCETLSVSSVSAPGFYARFGFTCWQRWRALTLRADVRNLQYEGDPCGLAPAALPAGWGMALGRIGSAAHMWDRFDPDERPPREAPLAGNVTATDVALRSGRERARVVFEDKAMEARGVAAYVWTPDGRLSPRMWAVLGDRAARLGRTHLTTWADDDRRAEVPPHARWGQHVREVWGLRL
jgi:GNAT superfamily N-acetyltransferase